MEISRKNSPLRRSSETGPLLSVKFLHSHYLPKLATDMPQPCSLNEFMDYLFYVEHNAEPLQFFLWYLDYIQRWSKLLPRQKALSPPWDPEQAAEPQSRFVKYSHKRERSLKMSKVISIMEMDSELSLAESLSSDDPSRLPNPSPSPTTATATTTTTVDAPSQPPTTILSPTDVPKKDWQPCKPSSLNPSPLPHEFPTLTPQRKSHHPPLPRRTHPHHAALPPHHRRPAPPRPLPARPRRLPARRGAHDPPLRPPPGPGRRRGGPARPLPPPLPALCTAEREPRPGGVCEAPGRAAGGAGSGGGRVVRAGAGECVLEGRVRAVVVARAGGACCGVSRGGCGAALEGEEAGSAVGRRGGVGFFWQGGRGGRGGCGGGVEGA